MIEIIISEINAIFNCDILAENRKRNNVDGRIAFCNYMRKNTNRTFQDIGNELGKSHSNIIHAIKTHDKLIKFNRKYREMYRQIGIDSSLKRWLCYECKFEIKIVKL